MSETKIDPPVISKKRARLLMRWLRTNHLRTVPQTFWLTMSVKPAPLFVQKVSRLLKFSAAEIVKTKSA